MKRRYWYRLLLVFMLLFPFLIVDPIIGMLGRGTLTFNYALVFYFLCGGMIWYVYHKFEWFQKVWLTLAFVNMLWIVGKMFYRIGATLESYFVLFLLAIPLLIIAGLVFVCIKTNEVR